MRRKDERLTEHDAPSTGLRPNAVGERIHGPFDGNAAGIEQTGGAAALTASSISEVAGLSTLGLRAQTRFAMAGDAFARPHGAVGALHAFGDTAPQTTLALEGGSDFAATGASLDRDTAFLQTGLAFDFGEGAAVSLDYNGLMGTSTQDHGLEVGLKLAF
ncbi:autotransporter outer membrane beta-barrel domain-containing protein [Roseibium sp. AS2]|uniref:autotransporter outer membrane beta-barrel domain-containing protein n=1 Tax=Roseibium sp. AS2 TaxID=3135781 RepID=UPI00317B1C66